MKKVRVFIERGEDGTFGAYMPDDNGLDWSVVGDGATIAATIADFREAYEEMKAYYQERGEAFEEVEFDFRYDVPSFLNYYKGLLTLAGLGRITGINERQLSQYVSGYRNPSAKTTKKIEAALHTFGSELQQVRFV